MPSVRATDLHCTNVENILMAQNWLVLCLQELWTLEIARSSREDEEYGLVDPSWKNESSNFKVFK